MSGKRCRVAQVGLGNRGTVHADAFLELTDRYELVGLCELREDRLRDYCTAKGLDPGIGYSDADAMLADTEPDVFCFVTQPHVRLELVELAVKHHVNAVDHTINVHMVPYITMDNLYSLPLIGRKVRQVPNCVCRVVVSQGPHLRACGHQGLNEVTPDETRSTGNQTSFPTIGV